MGEGYREIKKCTGLEGEDFGYIKYPRAEPPFSGSDYITGVKFDRVRYHCGEGDMWPVTWAEDGCLYGAAGDNKGVPMNFWKISSSGAFGARTDSLDFGKLTNTGDWTLDVQNPEPVKYREYALDKSAEGIKPAGLLDIGGKLFMSVEIHNYGECPRFNRQKNLHGWIVTSDDCGKTWNTGATPPDFFTGKLSSCHFLQFGRGYRGARDGYVYAYFPYDEDGCSYWENGDGLLLGRVLKEKILQREEWEFYAGGDGSACWDKSEDKAVPVFQYYKMTGENHVSYNPGIGRYIMGNYGFVDEELLPRPVHQMKWPQSHISQLTLYESEHPWGPWKLFYRDDNWGTYGDYQPSFPTKWMSGDGRLMCMVSSGSWDDYNFVVQKMAVMCRGDRSFPLGARYFEFLDI